MPSDREEAEFLNSVRGVYVAGGDEGGEFCSDGKVLLWGIPEYASVGLVKRGGQVLEV